MFAVWKNTLSQIDVQDDTGFSEDGCQSESKLSPRISNLKVENMQIETKQIEKIRNKTGLEFRQIFKP